MQVLNKQCKQGKQAVARVGTVFYYPLDSAQACHQFH